MKILAGKVLSFEKVISRNMMEITSEPRPIKVADLSGTQNQITEVSQKEWIVNGANLYIAIAFTCYVITQKDN